MNTLNQFLMTVNDKEIKKEEDNKRAGRFLVDVVINGKPHRQWTSNFLTHFEQCNKSGWQIQSVTMFIPEKVKEFRYIPGNNIR